MQIIITGLVLLILFTIFLKVHSRHKKPLKAAVINMFAGVSALVLVAPLASAAVNVYTVFTALALGVPGAVLVVLGSVFV